MSPTPVRKKAAKRVRGVYPRDVLIYLSLANLCYIRVWLPLLDRAYAGSVLSHAPNRVVLIAAMIGVLALASVFTAVTSVIRHHPSMLWVNVGRGLFVVALIFPLYEFTWVARKQYDFVYAAVASFGAGQAGVLFGVLGAGLMYCVWRWHVPLARLLAIVLVALSPGVLVTFGQAALRMKASDHDPLGNHPLAPMNAKAPRTPRVLWFLFDEWDYRLTFTQRNSDLQLPEIDRFAQTALTTSNAIPPGSETLSSIPMLLTGERYESERVVSASQIEVHPYDDPKRTESWGARDMVFGEARAMGVNTGLVGWYLPYCRLISGQLNGCEWLPIERPENSIRDDSIPHAMLDQARSVFETTTFSPFGASLAAQSHVRTYRQLLGDSIHMAADPNYGLVFAHLPVPHYPFIYDRKTQSYSRISFSPERYVDSLALLDRTIGEIRRSLEAAGQWEDSTIILTSDHYYRWAKQLTGRYHSRVPFLVKLPRQKHGVIYERRFNTLTTRKLVMAILRGEVQTPEQLTAWLDRNAIVCDTIGARTE
jgi:hypothetical protein